MENEYRGFPGSLHNHTEYSNLRLRDCIIKIESLLSYAEELKHNVVAITDHETIANWIKVEYAAQKHPNLKVIRGNEIYLVRNGLNAENYNKDFDRYYHFVLLAKDLVGAKQIMEISTRAWLRSYMARGMRRVPTYYQDLWDIIAKDPGHVIGSTACLGGALPTQILRGTSDDKLGIWINQMKEIFGEGNFYFELQPSHNWEQLVVNKKLLKFSKEYNVPYIITTDSHYLKKEDRAIHKAYLNAQGGEREVDAFYATTYMMNDEEIRSFFTYLSEPELRAAYDSIQKIADSCENYSLLKPLKIPELQWRELPQVLDSEIESKAFASMPTLYKFAKSEHKSDRYLVNAIIAGIMSHPDLQNDEAYAALEDNLQRTWESSEVNKARWSAYYLNLQKNIDECWNAGTVVGPARGSGGGFVLLYCLDVIQMNCLREPTPMFPWRFLNPARVSVLDIDTDIEGGRRAQVLQHLRNVYGDDHMAQVATFRTEKSKSAILTAARGLGIDVDTAQYLAGLVPADRGQLRSLDECMYGNEDKGFTPIKQFVTEMTENYPDLWNVAHGIEDLICGSGIHAGGVIFVDEPFTESTALMRAPDGTICTQFELHDCEAVSLIKIDLLSIKAMDQIHICIDLLCDYGYAERKETLRETYESIVGIYNIERNDPKMWQMVIDHKIESLFQLEKQSGVTGIALAKPHSVDELAVLNSVIRLMAPEKGAEQPLNMWARYRGNINEWYKEMRDYGLTEEQIDWLGHHSAIHNGICEAQEGMMSLVQEPQLGGNDLSFADKCRKAIAKKQGKLFVECEEYFFKHAEESGCDMTLAHYVWDVVFKVQRGYSFNASHTHAYSLVALQEMNLAYSYPIVFWNCACLINDSGGNEMDETEEELQYVEEETYVNEMEDFGPEDSEEDVEDSYDEDEDCDGYPVEVKVMKDGKKKKKTKANNYGKIASAIGKMQSTGVKVAPPEINHSSYTFSPDVENNMIVYGLSGIIRIGEDVIKAIIANRPYSGIEDFLSKVKVNKTQMINLIKCGAFDEFGNREDLMNQYLGMISETKTRLTLQNVATLIAHNLLPADLAFEVKVFNFNKYLRKLKDKQTDIITFDDIALNFYSKNFDMDNLNVDENGNSTIAAPVWKAIYDRYMANVKKFIVDNHDDLLNELNSQLIDEMRNKYALGNLAKWSMDSVCFYQDEHELDKADPYIYECEDFFSLPEEPEVANTFKSKDGHEIKMFKLTKIMGTVIDKNKMKSQITLLTTHGVVNVQAYGIMPQYDKQISEVGSDGHKHVLEKSWFSRGNKIIVTGMRRGEDTFVAKKYKSTPGHHFVLITDVDDDGNLEIQEERIEVNA